MITTSERESRRDKKLNTVKLTSVAVWSHDKMRQFCKFYDLTAPVASVTRKASPYPTPYLSGWKYQKALMDKIHSSSKDGRIDPFPDCLVLLEHSSVYTLGKGGTINNLKFDPSDHQQRNGKDVYRVSRGGEVTWHGPGQLVVYPIIDLHRHKKDLRWYLSKLEDTIIQTLESFEIFGGRSSVNPGVWVGRNKICAVGITCSRWITMHGLALNVNCDLTAYDHITPCGILPEIGGVCSMAQFRPSLTLPEVKEVFLQKYREQFQFEYVEGTLEELEQLVHENPEVSREAETLSSL
jgi:lipoyl(octanoyl) transferase